MIHVHGKSVAKWNGLSHAIRNSRSSASSVASATGHARARGVFSNSATSPKRRQFSDGPLSHKHNRRHRSSSIPAQGPQPSLQAGKVSLSRDFHWTNSIVVGVLIKIYISAWQHECLEAARISKKHRRPPAMTDPETSMSSKVQLKENRFMRSPVKNTIATSFTGV